jgi:peptidoglycan/LPS O-acetylase OafA/YrhL
MATFANQASPPPESARDRALDGWREVAALLVVVGYLAYFRLENTATGFMRS